MSKTADGTLVGVPYLSPVSTDMYGALATILLLIGLASMALFFVYAVKPSKNIVVEVFLGAIASFFLGFASLFVFLWADIYV